MFIYCYTWLGFYFFLVSVMSPRMFLNPHPIDWIESINHLTCYCKHPKECVATCRLNFSLPHCSDTRISLINLSKGCSVVMSSLHILLLPWHPSHVFYPTHWYQPCWLTLFGCHNFFLLHPLYYPDTASKVENKPWDTHLDDCRCLEASLTLVGNT